MAHLDSQAAIDQDEMGNLLVRAERPTKRKRSCRCNRGAGTSSGDSATMVFVARSGIMAETMLQIGTAAFGGEALHISSISRLYAAAFEFLDGTQLKAHGTM